MSSSRQIGVTFEREIAKRFRRWFPDARRGLQYQAGEHCPDIVETPFYVECKKGNDRYIKHNQKYYNPHKTAPLAWLYGIISDRADEWDGNGECVVIVWRLKGAKHEIMVTLAHNDWWKLRGDTSILELQDALSTITWTEFAEVLDKRYRVKE